MSTATEAPQDWRPVPAPVPMEGLPTAVRVYEVGPRDGLQAEPVFVPTPVKAEFCRRLVAAGIAHLEVTSFVAPAWVPQLADAEALLASLDLPDRVRHVELVSNARGLDRAVAAGSTEVAVLASATAAFARKNLNTTVPGALEAAGRIAADAAAAGLRSRGYVSMCFGDPWEGAVDPARVADLCAALLEAGCASVSLGDTIGVATPGHVARLLGLLRDRGVPMDRLAVHFHDTYGQALSNVLAALREGVSEVDSSAGGLGRCPYAKGATGNLATEDLVWMLDGLGIATGVDLDALVRTSVWMAERTGTTSPSGVVRAWTAART